MPQQMLIAHFGEIRGDGVAEYLRDARAVVQTAAELVLRSHARGKSLEEILAACTEKFYVGSLHEYQPIEGFHSNMRAMILRLIEETENRRRKKGRGDDRR